MEVLTDPLFPVVVKVEPGSPVSDSRQPDKNTDTGETLSQPFSEDDGKESKIQSVTQTTSFEVQFFLPPFMSYPSYAYFTSINAAAKSLNVSYYFLYNCYHQTHHNQFAKFFKITKMDPSTGKYLPYSAPRVNAKRLKTSKDEEDQCEDN